MVSVNRILLVLLVLMSPAFVSADVIEIDNAALQKLKDSGATIIDVRRDDEWLHTGILEGSHGITFFDKRGRYDVNAWLSDLDKLIKPDQPVVLICARGVRSSKIAELLDKRLGYSQVHNVTDGIQSWLKSDLPVVPWSPPQ
ncbi:MAG: rhodanese-like domain-containing protein [Granulosicoccus sp.]